jgi:hypothetical protein
LSKVYEVDEARRRGLAQVFCEGHPEVSFALMRGGSPFSIGKKKREEENKGATWYAGTFPMPSRAWMSMHFIGRTFSMHTLSYGAQ